MEISGSKVIKIMFVVLVLKDTFIQNFILKAYNVV